MNVFHNFTLLKTMGWILGFLLMARISTATILLDVYQIYKWSFYKMCKLLGIQTLSTCFQKFEICAHVMICWCHPNSISKFETNSYHMNFDESNSIGGHLESIYVVELYRFEWECVKWANSRHFQFNLWKTK
jgi:hypothetical protein